MWVQTRRSIFAIILLTFTTLAACRLGSPKHPHAMKGPDSYDLSAKETAGREGKLEVAAGEIWDAARHQKISFEQLVERLSNAQVVYVGEHHDSWQHHRVQHRLLEALSRGGASLAIGLEMLPRGVQPALDAFIAGESDERASLKAMGWYEHWGYDYRFYRPIFELARKHKHSIYGLNLPSKLVRQVSRKGLAALDKAEREQLPKVYLDSKEHRRVFDALIGGAGHHPTTKKKAPHHEAKKARMDRFYQAQSLWDEAMAERVAASLGASPQRRVVVFAGSGHMVYDLGISMRLRRRLPDLRQAIVVPVEVEKGRRRVARQLADFVVGVAPDGPRDGFPTLGVMLSEKDGKLTVLGVVKKGAAERAGVKKKDQLSALDGRPISKRAQLREWLLDKKWGDAGRLGLIRGKAAMELEVRFEPSK